jgi:ABC-2 type transport system ATP-binding protein
MNGIVCRRLSKAFADGRGVFDLDLSIGHSTSFALVGANGAGKTTLLNLCLGFLQPDQGDIWIDGIHVNRDPVAAKGRLAYVPEVARLYPHLTALQNMALFDGLMGHEHPAESYRGALSHLAFPLAAAGERVATYSKGMRQKLAIAIGLVKGANVFLLDEPTSGLDPRSAIEFADLIRTLRGDGKTILFSSHDLQSVYECADRVGVLHRGRMAIEEPATDFRARNVSQLYRELECAH